jgi:hypothetical protein
LENYPSATLPRSGGPSTLAGKHLLAFCRGVAGATFATLAGKHLLAFATPDFRFRISDFRLHISDFRFHKSVFGFQISDFRLHKQLTGLAVSHGVASLVGVCFFGGLAGLSFSSVSLRSVWQSLSFFRVLAGWLGVAGCGGLLVVAGRW